MIGFKFLVLGQENKPLNHGTIIEKVGEGKYLCQFTRIPTSCRVVDVTEIQGWNLFPTGDAMNAFIAALEKKPADPPKDPPADPKLKKKGKRNDKKAKKSKTSNGK